MKHEEAMQVLQMYKDEIGQRIDKASAPEVKDVYQWQMDGFDMAIEALQRGIPKNPIINFVADSDGARRLNDGWTEDSYLCPVCHTYFGEVFDEGYCYLCGQKLIQKRVRVIKE